MTFSFNIKLKSLFGRICTSSTEKTRLLGRVFQGDLELTANDLEPLALNAIAIKDKKFFQELNGFFTFIINDGEKIYIVSDKVRSRPIFYSLEKKCVVSDDFYTVAKISGQKEIKKQAKQEFLRTGYVTSIDTLVEGIYQLEAAQIVEINSHGQSKRLNYWYFFPEKNIINNNDKYYWYKQLDSALKKSIGRLLKIANGRQIVIPLSGGYDSRAIAVYLTKAGYKNLIAFTFGNKGSHEVAMSERIAKSLGIEWHCITYTRGVWKELKKSEELKGYMRIIGSGVSVANIQVFPAIKELISSNIIANDAVVVPGHAADFVAGSHIPKNHDTNLDDVKSLSEYLIGKHYGRKTGLDDQFKERIMNSLGESVNDCTRNDYIKLSESWNWRERQSKFIANSNRYYDFFGLDWWMPFWDNEFISLWEKVPHKHRLNTTLWTDFVNSSMKDLVGSQAPTGRSETGGKMGRRVKSIFNYFYDPNGLFALVPFNRWLFSKVRVSAKPGTVFGILSEKYLQDLDRDLKND